jgi:hypothetical protein
MKQLIRKILKEETLKQSLIDEIKEYGFKDTVEMVGGIDNLFKVLNIETPMDFLHLFDDLDVVQSEEEPNWTLFRYRPKHNLIVYERKNDYAHIDYDEIWSVLGEHFELSYTETQELTKEWLGEVYNLRRITTPQYLDSTLDRWVRSII